MWVILFTAKSLILLIVRLGRPSQKVVKKKKKKSCLDKRALWASRDKGAGAHLPK